MSLPSPLTTPINFYSSKISACAATLQALRNKARYVAWARGISFVVAAMGVYCYFSTGQTLPAIIAALALVAFLILIRYALDLRTQIRLSDALHSVATNEKNICQGGKNIFDNGNNWEDSDDPGHSLAIHTKDLDVFGPGSLYHALNRCSTTYGKQHLSRRLRMPLTDRSDIIALQEAVAGLGTQHDLRLDINAYALMLGSENDSISELAQWVQLPAKMIPHRWLMTIRFILPTLALLALLYYINGGSVAFLGLSALVNWGLLLRFGAYVQKQHHLIGRKQQTLEQYSTILRLFANVVAGESSILARLQKLSHEGLSQIGKLSKLSSFFDQRMNMFIGFFLNTFLLYDIQVVVALEKWKKRNAADVLKWLDATGEIEMLNSFAIFYFNHPSYVLPVIANDKPFIESTGLGHPLIDVSAQVTNELSAGTQEQCLLITGSNMSGKSTFLRAVGVNMVLAQCGLPVNAEKFSFSPMTILSSIRITDSLQENTSYFMAELKRLATIIDFLKSGQPALVLLDEVLRGTNSADKTLGSSELIRRLLSFNCLSFFATHDLSLGRLETQYPGRVKNFCFESVIANGELSFDYRLRAGIAVNKNASYLMRSMGIIE